MSDDPTTRMEDELDAAFAALRRAEADAPPSQAFLARVLADAATAMPTPAAPPAPKRQGGWLSSVLDGLGGWSGGAALTASALVGVYIGYSGLADAVSDGAFGGDVAFYDGYSGFADEADPEG